MLINIRISELQNNTANSIPLAILIIISLIYSIFKILPYDIAILNNYNYFLNNKLYNNFNKNLLNENKLTNISNDEFLFVTSNSWDANLLEINHMSSIGNVLYTSHNIWLIITSFILLLAMVGAIVITVKNNKN
jgi:NADH-ubiquinone oxidoreductase chain 6